MSLDEKLATNLGKAALIVMDQGNDELDRGPADLFGILVNAGVRVPVQ